VFTDGRDPQEMTECAACGHEPEQHPGDSIRPCETDDGCDDLIPNRDQPEWLAAYRAMVKWVEGELATAPERVRNLAQQIAMDEVGREAGERAFATFRNRGAVPA
jgi:hypothetical protein